MKRECEFTVNVILQSFLTVSERFMTVYELFLSEKATRPRFKNERIIVNRNLKPFLTVKKQSPLYDRSLPFMNGLNNEYNDQELRGSCGLYDQSGRDQLDKLFL